MLITVLTSMVTAILTALVAIGLAERRLSREFRLEFMAENVARELLESEKWKLRSFDTISARLGGFTPDELRKILVRAGAVRFTGKDGKEYWGLLKRNKDDLSD